MIPKQIIYPLRYLRATLPADDASTESEKFREALEELLGADVGLVPLGRARMGIFLLVKQAIAGQKRKVILSPYTIPDVVNMVVLAGGEPVFVDFLPRSTNIDLDHLQHLMKDDVACVVITHYHVNQGSFELIKDLCGRRGVLLFEDCAISLSAKIDDKHVGTQSDGAMLSFSGFKFLNYFWGGSVFSKNKSIAKALQAETKEWPRLTYRDYFPQMLRTMKYDFATRGAIFDLIVFPLLKRRQSRSVEAVNLAPPRLETVEIDKTLKSSPSGAALSEWNGKLPLIPKYLEHRREIAAIYDQYLMKSMVSSEVDESIKKASGFVNYPIYVGQSARNSIYKSLIRSGIDIGASLYPNCHEHPKFRSVEGKSENVNDLVRSVITLPTHPRMDAASAHVLGKALAAMTGQVQG